MNIISDIAGQHDALMRLVDLMPKEEIVLVGDLVDRGPNSKEVIQWAIDNKIKTILGNHEHMMIDFYEQNGQYDIYIWHYNGGNFTSLQYKDDPKSLKEHLKWLNSLPLYYQFDGLFVSHGPLHAELTLESACRIDNFEVLGQSLLWNRDEPKERDDFQMFGHNSPWGLRWFGEKENPWAVCLDSSSDGILTGINWPNKKIYQVPYIQKKKLSEVQL